MTVSLLEIIQHFGEEDKISLSRYVDLFTMSLKWIDYENTNLLSMGVQIMTHVCSYMHNMIDVIDEK